MSQQPYQPGQPGGYQQPGQPGYPGQPGQSQGGYQQPTQPGQPGFGGYPGGSPQQYGGSRGGNPLSTPAGLAPILQILGIVLAVLGVIAGIIAFTIDYQSGGLKFYQFCASLILGLGFGGVLLALGALLKSKAS